MVERYVSSCLRRSQAEETVGLMLCNAAHWHSVDLYVSLFTSKTMKKQNKTTSRVDIKVSIYALSCFQTHQQCYYGEFTSCMCLEVNKLNVLYSCATHRTDSFMLLKSLPSVSFSRCHRGMNFIVRSYHSCKRVRQQSFLKVLIYDCAADHTFTFGRPASMSLIIFAFLKFIYLLYNTSQKTV